VSGSRNRRSAVFLRYWTAAAISSFGTAVTTVAMPVLVVQVLKATPLEVGIVNAAQFVPYALLGILAGVYTDRWRRRPILDWASVGRALSLGAVPLLWMFGVLEIWMLVVALLLFGSFSVFGFAAAQSLLPRLVSRDQLLRANMRLDQTDAAAQTLGPSIGGGLVALLGASVAILIGAVSYLVDAALNAGLRVEEPRRAARAPGLRVEIVEGMRWTYRHPTLGPLTVSTHVWFVANGAAMTALSLLALRELGFSAVAYGLLLTVFGVASLVGASSAAAITGWFGAGRAIVGARALYPLAWLLVVTAPPSQIGVVAVFIALAVQGFAMGAENSPEQLLWQTLTPDRLLGRTNATRRAGNRTLAAIGALAAGAVVGLIGDRAALAGAVVVFAAAGAIAAFSPLRSHRDEAPPEFR